MKNQNILGLISKYLQNRKKNSESALLYAPIVMNSKYSTIKYG